jgi:hypothetical protein
MKDFSSPKQGLEIYFLPQKKFPPHFSLRQKVLIGGSFLVFQGSFLIFQVLVIQFGCAKTVSA